MRDKFVILCLIIALFVMPGCTELNWDELVFVPAMHALLDAATSGIHTSVNEQISNRFGDGPIPEAAATGLSSAVNSLVDYVIDETVGDRLPEQ